MKIFIFDIYSRRFRCQLSAKFELRSASTWPMKIDCMSFLRPSIVNLPIPNAVEHAERRRSATSLHGL
jgi:hypothetical protein